MLKINLINVYNKKINNITELLNVTKENDVFYLKDIIELKENKMKSLISNTFNFDSNLSTVCTSFHVFKVLDVFNALCLREINNKNRSATYKYLYNIVNSIDSVMHYLNDIYKYRYLFDFNNFAHLFIWLRLSGVNDDDTLVDVLNIILDNDTGKVISILLTLYSYIINIDVLDDVLCSKFYYAQYQFRFLNRFIRKQFDPYKHVCITTTTTTHDNGDPIILHTDNNNNLPDITSCALLTIHDIIITESKK